MAVDWDNLFIKSVLVLVGFIAIGSVLSYKGGDDTVHDGGDGSAVSSDCSGADAGGVEEYTTWTTRLVDASTARIYPHSVLVLNDSPDGTGANWTVSFNGCAAVHFVPNDPDESHVAQDFLVCTDGSCPSDVLVVSGASSKPVHLERVSEFIANVTWSADSWSLR